MSNTRTAIIIPIKRFEKSKSRLSGFLSQEQRIWLCQLMVNDLIEKLAELEESNMFLVTNEIIPIPEKAKEKVVMLFEGRSNGVNDAVKIADSHIKKNKFDKSIVIPIDIPLLTLIEIKEIISVARDFKEIIGMVPSNRFDGTNILLRKPHSIIDTSFDDNSFFNHCKKAHDNGISLKIFYHENLTVDLDTIDDVMMALKKYHLAKSTIKMRGFEQEEVQKNQNKSIEYLMNIFQNGDELDY
ncbi:MAG TPA: 2-phospho-L-lactate guanylyltransferase [Candidatus Nitrosocosmicus sp.]|nr:2-phospho-L-lactate guanylyltransferase [Candidatus Nitrosocosmicus sp.]